MKYERIISPVSTECAGDIAAAQVVFARHTESHVFGRDDFIVVLDHDVIGVGSASVVGRVAAGAVQRHGQLERSRIDHVILTGFGLFFRVNKSIKHAIRFDQHGHLFRLTRQMNYTYKDKK